MQSLTDWLAYLESFHPKGQGGIELGLDRVGRVKSELEQKTDCPLIVVGGTNGKGSTCAYLESICFFSGYRVGCYTSPHLLDYNERIRVNRRPVDDETLCRAFARVDAARKTAGDVWLTYFEFGTLAAWEVFAQSRLDVIILEVGLGGRLDAVNIYDSDVAIVTGVALDHTDWLGTTREAIGFEKAGIFRAGKPAICADSEPPTALLEHAQAIGADIHLIDRDFGYRDKKTQWDFWQRDRQDTNNAIDADESHIKGWNDLPSPALRGVFQKANASTALMALAPLKNRLLVSEAAIRRGLSECELKGRFEVFPGPPKVIFDVAHNPQAAAVLVDNLDSMETSGKTFAVVGMLADKDIAGVMAALSEKIDVWLLASLDASRGATARTLAGFAGNPASGKPFYCFLSPEDAFSYAAKQAGENDRILVFGSFFTVAAVMRTIKHLNLQVLSPAFLDNSIPGCTNV